MGQLGDNVAAFFLNLNEVAGTSKYCPLARINKGSNTMFWWLEGTYTKGVWLRKKPIISNCNSSWSPAYVYLIVIQFWPIKARIRFGIL